MCVEDPFSQILLLYKYSVLLTLFPLICWMYGGIYFTGVLSECWLIIASPIQLQTCQMKKIHTIYASFKCKQVDVVLLLKNQVPCSYNITHTSKELTICIS